MSEWSQMKKSKLCRKSVTGQNSIGHEIPLKSHTDMNTKFVAHVLKHYPALRNYNENGLVTHHQEFHSGAPKKVIALYANLIGKKIEIPVMHEISVGVFESLGDLNKFRNKFVLEKDVISVESLNIGIGCALVYWETP